MSQSGTRDGIGQALVDRTYDFFWKAMQRLLFIANKLHEAIVLL
jgi:hypothetical protein